MPDCRTLVLTGSSLHDGTPRQRFEQLRAIVLQSHQRLRNSLRFTGFGLRHLASDNPSQRGQAVADIGALAQESSKEVLSGNYIRSAESQNLLLG